MKVFFKGVNDGHLPIHLLEEYYYIQYVHTTLSNLKICPFVIL